MRETIPVDELKNMPVSVLVNIYKTMNYWRWPTVLGDVPDGWDELPNYKKPWMRSECKTKAEIIRPYAEEITKLIPSDEIYPNRNVLVQALT